MMKLAIKILIITILLSVPTATIYASGGHDTPAGESSDASHDTPMSTLFLSIGIALIVTFVGGFTFSKELGTISHLAILMMSITGALHFIVGVGGDYLLLLNGAGYFGLLALRYILLPNNPQQYKLLDIGIILYTLATIGGYFVLHTTSDTVGLLTKGFEVALIGLLAMDILSLSNQDNDSAKTNNQLAQSS